jgi:parallel beta-helix repeat protein
MMEKGRRKSGTAWIIVILFVVVTLVSVGCASASTYYVNPGGSIQDAMNAADPGDTIIVGDGTYIENIDVNKRLTIKSENGADSTIVRAVDNHIFNITADHVNIIGFTIEEASNNCGVSITDANNCNISNNIVSGNYQGIHLSKSSRNTIFNNNVLYFTPPQIELFQSSETAV